MASGQTPIGRGRGLGRGRGRTHTKDWPNQFKPNPPPISVNEILKSLNDRNVNPITLPQNTNPTTTTTNNSTPPATFTAIPHDQQPPASVTTADTFRYILQNAVTANAFVPQYFKTQYTTTTAPSFIPPPDEKPPLQRLNSGGSMSEFMASLADNTNEEKAHIFLQNYVMTLTENPEEFRNVIAEIGPALSEHKSEAFLKSTIDIIFEHAKHHTNFCYSAARLFEHFGREKIFEESSFRNAFYTRCKIEFTWLQDKVNAAGKTATSTEEFTVITNIAILFGELFNNMKIKDKPNTIFRKVVLDIVDLFLRSKEERLIRQLVKLLKLSGPELDCDRPKDIEAMFDRVRDFYFDQDSSFLSEEVKKSVLAVYKLHTRDWDRVTSPVPPISPVAPNFNNVWINPRLTRKKSASSAVDWNDYYQGDDSEFAAGHHSGEMHAAYDAQGYPDIRSESSYDDEVGDDFEEFLRQSGQL